MSSITGSCSESPATALFEKGLEQAQSRLEEQNKHLLEKSISRQEHVSTTSVTGANPSHLGSRIDTYA